MLGLFFVWFWTNNHGFDPALLVDETYIRILFTTSTPYMKQPSKGVAMRPWPFLSPRP